MKLPEILFEQLLNQAERTLGKRPRITRLYDGPPCNANCQGGLNVDVESAYVIIAGEGSSNDDHAVVVLKDTPPLSDTVLFVTGDNLNRAVPEASERIVDNACAQAGCQNGANCVLRR